MNVLGKTKLFINGFDVKGVKGGTRLNCSVTISTKDKDDEWVTAFLPVKLSNAVKENLGIDEKSLKKLYEKQGRFGNDIRQSYNIKLEDNNAWLTCDKYKDKNGKEKVIISLFINDLTIVTDDEKPVESSRERR